MESTFFHIQHGILIEYTGNEEHVVIPEGIHEIGFEAFKLNENLKTVVCPKGLKKINNSAFALCSSLYEVKLNDDLLEIHKHAFFSCTQLRVFYIPQCLKLFHEEALSLCKNLQSIVVNQSNSYFCSVNGVLFSKDKRELICFPPHKNEKSYIIPKNTIKIGNYAFAYCENLVNIYFHNNIQKIGQYAFCGCENVTSLLLPPTILEIEEGTFAECRSLQNFVIPKHVKVIKEEAFKFCTSLHTVIIPNEVKEIKSDAFNSCKSLKFVNLPSNCITLGVRAFAYSNLETIILPDSIKHIGYGIFKECEHLKKIYLSNQNANYLIENDVLFSKNKKELLYYPIWKTNKIFDIPYGVEKIGNGAFSGSKFLEEINIPDTLRDIDDFAFSNCMNLKKAGIPFGVVKIGDCAFCECVSLTEVYLPRSLKYLGEDVFFESDFIETIYCEVKEQPVDWIDDFHKYDAQIIWGHKLNDSFNNKMNRSSSIASPSQTESFVFLSYSHADKEKVMPYFEALKQANINIWFDEGIKAGYEWEKEIIHHLSNADSFIFFVTESSLLSTNCRDELYQARKKNKKFINVLIDEIDLSKPEYEWFDFRYSRYQQIFAYSMSISETIKKIYKSIHE